MQFPSQLTNKKQIHRQHQNSEFTANLPIKNIFTVNMSKKARILQAMYQGITQSQTIYQDNTYSQATHLKNQMFA